MGKVETLSKPVGFFYITIAVLGWGLSTSFIEFGLEFVNPLPFLSYRFIVATIILFPWVYAKKKKEVFRLLEKRLVWIIGVSEALGLMFQYFGQKYVPASLSALLSLLFLIFVPFLAWIILNERIKVSNLAAALLGLTGAMMIALEGEFRKASSSSIIGTVLLLLAALSYGLYITTTSKLTRYGKEDVDSLALFFAVLLIISITTFLSTLVSGQDLEMKKEAWIWLIGLVIFSTIIAFIAYFEALKVISASTASVVLLLQILVPFFIDLVILRRSFSDWVWVGSIVILFAMSIAVVAELKTND